MPLTSPEKQAHSVYQQLTDYLIRALPMFGKASLALLAQALISGSNFFLSILLARWLLPGQYGAYTLAFSIFLFASSCHNALLLEPMAVLGPASYGKSLPVYVGRLIRFHFGIALVLALFVGLGAIAVPHLSGATSLPAALWGACLGIPFILLFLVLRQAAYVNLRPDLAARGAVTYAIVMVLILYVLRFTGWITPFSAFATQAIAGLVGGVFLITWIRSQLNLFSDTISMRSIWRQHWKYGRWVVLTAFVYWLSGQAYYFIAAAVLKIEDVGTVSALQNFVAPLSQFVTALSLLLLPWASARFASRDRPSFQRAINRISLLFVCAGVAYLACISVFGKWLTLVLYHGKYIRSTGLIPVLAFSGALIAASQGPAIGLRAMQAPSGVFVAYSAAAALSILAGFTFTLHWGLVGNVFGMAMSSLCFLITVTYCYRSRLKRAELNDRSERVHLDVETTGIAWLMPSLARGNYWQPVFRDFTKLFPNSTVFTGMWPGFLPGYEGSFHVRYLPGHRFVTFKKSAEGYDRGLIWAPPLGVIRELLKFRPSVIFTSSFSIWTLYAIVFKVFIRCRVIILYEGISPNTSYLDSPLRLKIRQIMARFADAGVSNMHGGIEYLRASLGISDSKLIHHPYEVPDTSILCSGVDQVGFGPSPQLGFLFVGSLITRKGWTCLMEASRLLVQRGLNRFSVTIVGSGDQAEDVRMQISSRGLERFVHQAGQVAYKDLGAYYRASDVFVFPTHEDVWGVVLLEAMAFGKPVLCSKYAGSQEMVQHGRNGFIFDSYKPEELAGYMARFIENPGLVTEFGERAYKTIAPYTPTRAASVLANLVTSLLKPVEEGTVISALGEELSSD